MAEAIATMATKNSSSSSMDGRSSRSSSTSTGGSSGTGPGKDFGFTADVTIVDLDTLQDRIVCSSCKKQYRSPKTLPCLHSFCLSCLQELSTSDSMGSTVECPQCNKQVRVPGNDLTNFSSAFSIIRQVELFNFLQKVNGRVDIRCEKCSSKSVKACSYCRDCGKFICDLCVQIHKSWFEFQKHKLLTLRELKDCFKDHIPQKIVPSQCGLHQRQCTVFCETCKEQICHECIVKLHRDHEYNMLEESAVSHKTRLRDSLDSILDMPCKLEKAITTINAISHNFCGKGKVVTDEINFVFDKLEREVMVRRQLLLQELATLVDSKVQLLQDQSKALEKCKDKVSSCREFVDQMIASRHNSEFFILEKQMDARINEVKKEFSRMELTPAEEPEVYFSFDQQIIEQAVKAGSVSDGSILYAGTKGSLLFDANEVITFYVALSSAFYKNKGNATDDIRAEIQSLRDRSICGATVAVSNSGFAKMQCSFSERGRYAVHIKMGTRHISGSPYVFYVKPLPTQFQAPVKSIGKLNSPRGITVNKKYQIVVTEEAKHIMSVFGKKSKKMVCVGSLGPKESDFNHPMGVACDSDDYIYVADSKNDRIQKFDKEGEFVTMFSGVGVASCSKPLMGPTGVKIDSKGRVFVVDRGNSRIVVLNSDMEYETSFGSASSGTGTGLGQLQDPWDLALDKNGHVYVTDTKQHCILIYAPTGEFRGRIGGHGTQKGRLNRPSGISIDSFGRIYVCEFGNHRVSVFHVSSEFLDCFSMGLTMVNPCGVTVDDDGYVYITTSENIHVF